MKAFTWYSSEFSWKLPTNQNRSQLWNHFAHSCGLEKSNGSGVRMLNVAFGPAALGAATTLYPPSISAQAFFPSYLGFTSELKQLKRQITGLQMPCCVSQIMNLDSNCQYAFTLKLLGNFKYILDSSLALPCHSFLTSNNPHKP